MLPYSYIHNAPFDQLVRWWDSTDSLPEDFDEDGIWEVAYALSTHRPEGVEVLKCSLDGADQLRHRSALHSLAWPDLADEDVREALRRAFNSEDRDLKYAALWGYIHLSYFPVARSALSGLLNGGDQRMAALAMVYLSHAFPEDSVNMLREALKSPNPRMREYACDEIGDLRIEELKEGLRMLLDDMDSDVAQAAAINLELW